MLHRADLDPLLEIYGRAFEMTKRIALILACGRYASRWMVGCEVDAADVKFARRLVDWSAQTFIRDLRENMAENEFQASVKFVLGILRKERTLTGAELSHKIDSRFSPQLLASHYRGSGER